MNHHQVFTLQSLNFIKRKKSYISCRAIGWILIFMGSLKPIYAQVQHSSTLINTDFSFSNFQGFDFDENSNAVVAFQILPVSSSFLSQNKDNCQEGLMNVEFKTDKKYLVDNALFNAVANICPGFSDQRIPDRYEKSDSFIYILVKYLFPVDTPYNQYGHIASVEPFAYDLQKAKYKYLRNKLHCFPVVSAASLDQKYPKLELTKIKYKVDFESTGVGLSIKNTKLYTEISQSSRKAWDQILTKETPFYKQHSKDYHLLFNNMKEEISEKGNKRFAGVSQRLKEGDNFASYQNFIVLFADHTGKIYDTIEIVKQYLKAIKSFSPVYNTDAEIKGIFLLLNNQPALKKSLKDPVENNVHVLVSDFNKDIFINRDFAFGNPENSRWINPVFTISDGEKLRILNINSNKFFKPYAEVLEIDQQGNIQATALKNTPKSGFFNTDSFKLVKAGNHYILYSLYKASPGSAISNSAPFAPPQNKYKSAYIALLDPKTFEIVSSMEYERGFDEIKSVEFVDENPERVLSVFNFDAFSTAIALNKNKESEAVELLKVAKNNKLLTLPPSAQKIDLKPYVIDKKSKKLYFINMASWFGNTIYFNSYTY